VHISTDFGVKRNESEYLVIKSSDCVIIRTMILVAAYKVMLRVCHWQKVHRTL